MSKINKGFICLPLFLLCAIGCGSCSNATIQINVDLPKKLNDLTDSVDPMFLYGDYDRLFTNPGQIKPGYDYSEAVKEPLKWDYWAQRMNYYQNDNGEKYYEAIIKLEKNDSFYGQYKYNFEAKYHDNIGSKYFRSDSGYNNIFTKESGIYRIRYNPSKVVNEEYGTGWLPAEKITLPTKRVYWKYSNPSLITDKFKQGGITLTKKMKVNNEMKDVNITGWANLDYCKFDTDNGYNYADVSVALANGYNSAYFTYNNYGFKTPTFSLDLLKDCGEDEAIFIDIDNTQDMPISIKLSTDRRNKLTDFKVTNKTARLWLDPGVAFNDNFIPKLHLWGPNTIKSYLPIEKVNMSADTNKALNLYYYDIDKEYFTSDYKFKFLAYKKADGNYAYDTHEQVLGGMNPGKYVQMYVTDGNYIGQEQNDPTDLKINWESFAKVLEAYYTCDPSKLNGYGDFATLLKWWTGDNYSKVINKDTTYNIKDYSTKSTDWKKEYETGSRSDDVLITNKIETMKQKYNDSLNKVQYMETAQDHTIAFVIIGLSISSVIVAILLIALKRKKARI